MNRDVFLWWETLRNSKYRYVKFEMVIRHSSGDVIKSLILKREDQAWNIHVGETNSSRRNWDYHIQWSQTKTNVICYCIYVESKKRFKWTLQNRNLATYREDKLMVTKGKDMEGQIGRLGLTYTHYLGIIDNQ